MSKAAQAKPSPVLRYTTIGVFAVMSLVMLGLCVRGSLGLALDITASAPQVTVNTITFRLLGLSILAGILALICVDDTSGIYKRFPTLEKYLGRVMMVGLVLMFLLPTLVHIPLERYLMSNGYKLCEPKSEVLRTHRISVYVKDVPTCVEGLSKKTQR